MGMKLARLKDWRYVGESIRVDTRESVPGEILSNQVDRITYSVSISPSPWPPNAWAVVHIWSGCTNINGTSVFFQQNELPPTKAALLVTDPLPMLNFLCVNTKEWHWTLSGVWNLKDINQLLRGRLMTPEFFHLGSGNSDHIISMPIWDFILLKERYHCFIKSIKRIHKYLWGISGLSIITDKPFGLICLDSPFSGHEVGEWVSCYHSPGESL